MTLKLNVVKEILPFDLCSGCGGCVGVCPTAALSIDIKKSFMPVLDRKKCINCGLCYEVCPGKGYPVHQISQKSCDDETKMHLTYGPIRHFWLGHTNNPKLRIESASGGIATELLVYLLEHKIVDAVGVVTLEDGYPQVRLTDDINIVVSASGSKYSPVPMMEIIRELRNNPRNIAITATPCQLAAFQTAAQKINGIRKCLVLAIGLFCGQVKDYESVCKIAASLNINYPADARFLGWRCGSYPGNARFEVIDGKIIEKPYYKAMDISIPHYALDRCFFCPDSANWLSDLTLGDIHRDGCDETVIVCRTQKGEQLLRIAESNGVISLSDMSPEQIGTSVIHNITGTKLKPALTRIKWRQNKRKAVPLYDYPVDEILNGIPWIIRFLYIIKYQLIMWARKGLKRRLLVRYPILMERTGHFLYNFPSSIPGWKIFQHFRKVTKR